MWLDLEGIMLSEISKTEKDKYYIISAESEKKRHPEKHREAWWLPEARLWEMRKCQSKSINFQLENE